MGGCAGRQGAGISCGCGHSKAQSERPISSIFDKATEREIIAPYTHVHWRGWKQDGEVFVESRGELNGQKTDIFTSRSGPRAVPSFTDGFFKTSCASCIGSGVFLPARHGGDGQVPLPPQLPAPEKKKQFIRSYDLPANEVRTRRRAGHSSYP